MNQFDDIAARYLDAGPLAKDPVMLEFQYPLFGNSETFRLVCNGEGTFSVARPESHVLVEGGNEGKLYGDASYAVLKRFHGQDEAVDTRYFDIGRRGGGLSLQFNEDGTRTRFIKTVDETTKDITIVEKTGKPSPYHQDTVIDGTETKTVYNQWKQVLSVTKKDIASGLLLSSKDADLGAGLDPVKRPIKYIYNGDPNDYTIERYNCCGLDFSRDRTGATIQYFRDGLKRPTRIVHRASSISPEVEILITYDGLTTTLRKSGGVTLFVESVTKNVAGDIVSRKTADGGRRTADGDGTPEETTYSTTYPRPEGEGNKVETVAYPAGSTRIINWYRDGQVKSITGTALRMCITNTARMISTAVDSGRNHPQRGERHRVSEGVFGFAGAGVPHGISGRSLLEHKFDPLSETKLRPPSNSERKYSSFASMDMSISTSQSWDAYNECLDLAGQIESYKERHGIYSESVHADAIYRTRANRAYCGERGIRLSGGLPQDPGKLAALPKQVRGDEIRRIPVEGKFGNAKRKGTLARIMAKLARTAQCVIHVGFIVLNLKRKLAALLLAVLSRLGLLLAPAARPAGIQASG